MSKQEEDNVNAVEYLAQLKAEGDVNEQEVADKKLVLSSWHAENTVMLYLKREIKEDLRLAYNKSSSEEDYENGLQSLILALAKTNDRLVEHIKCFYILDAEFVMAQGDYWVSTAFYNSVALSAKTQDTFSIQKISELRIRAVEVAYSIAVSTGDGVGEKVAAYLSDITDYGASSDAYSASDEYSGDLPIEPVKYSGAAGAVAGYDSEG